MIYELSVFDFLLLEQESLIRPYREEVIHQLVFNQSISHNIRTRKPSHKLLLNQEVDYHKSIINLEIVNFLGLTQSVIRPAIEISITSGYIIWQGIQLPLCETVTSELSYAQTIVGAAGVGFNNTLNLTNSVVRSVVRFRSVESELILENGVVGYMCDPKFNQLNPTITTIPQVKFQYGNHFKEFRKPDFGDKNTIDSTRINRRSRGGDLHISRASYWPETETLSLSFSYLKQEEVDWLLNFMKLTLGKKCQYLNYDNVLWEGFIMNPQTEARQLGRNNFSIDIDFEGVII